MSKRILESELILNPNGSVYHGADVNTKNKEDTTALTLAAFQGQTETLKTLLDAGAEVDARAGVGSNTALINAAMGGHAESVQVLLDSGADLGAKTTDGKTALMTAEEAGYTEIVELLKKAGAKE